MRRGRFEAQLDASGADLRTWPPDERTAALLLLRRSGAARADLLAAFDADPSMVAEAARLDPAIADRLLGGVRQRTAPAAEAPRASSMRALGWGALAACALAGVLVGWAGPPPAPAPGLLLASIQLTPVSDPPP